MDSNTGTLRWDFVGEPDAGILVAELDQIGFDAYQETHAGIAAFVREGAPLALSHGELVVLGRRLGYRTQGPVRVEYRNWNAAWEATVRPVHAGPFVVHPPWEEPTPGFMPILIEPRMSFGTGYHETTRLMLDALPDVVGAGDRVLDAGTGTGVLAIAAARLGAKHVTAFDTDPWSVRNAMENVASNGLSRIIDVVAGSVDAVPVTPVRVILGNINRTVLVDMLPTLSDRLEAGGRILLSGFLKDDQAVMESALVSAGFEDPITEYEGAWCATRANRP